MTPTWAERFDLCRAGGDSRVIGQRTHRATIALLAVGLAFFLQVDLKPDAQRDRLRFLIIDAPKYWTLMAAGIVCARGMGQVRCPGSSCPASGRRRSSAVEDG